MPFKKNHHTRCLKSPPPLGTFENINSWALENVYMTKESDFWCIRKYPPLPKTFFEWFRKVKSRHYTLYYAPFEFQMFSLFNVLPPPPPLHPIWIWSMMQLPCKSERLCWPNKDFTNSVNLKVCLVFGWGKTFYSNSTLIWNACWYRINSARM